MRNLILKIPFNILSSLYSVVVSFYENLFFKKKITIDKKIEHVGYKVFKKINKPNIKNQFK